MAEQDRKKRNEQADEELNLAPVVYLFRKLSNYISKKYSSIIYLIEKYNLIIGTFTAVGVLAGILNYYTAKPVYGTHAVIASNLLSNEYCFTILEDLRYLTTEENHKILASTLKIPNEVASQVVDIRFYQYKIAKQDTAHGEPFAIEVSVLNNDVLDTLQYAIINYLEEIPYAAKRKSVKHEILRDFTEKITKEIGELDSLKKTINRGLMVKQKDKEGELVGLGYMDPIDAYKEIIELYEHRLTLLEKKSLLSNFEIVQGFTKYNKPKSPKLIKDSVIYGFFTFLIGLLFASFKEKRSKKAKGKIDKVNFEPVEA